MERKYTGFKDLPIEVAQRLEKRIEEGRRKLKIPRGISTEEAIRLVQINVQDKDYSEKELEEIIDAFNVFNNATSKGLPNQLYQMIVKSLDVSLAGKAYAAHSIWYAHEGEELAKVQIQEFANFVKSEIDKRKDWDEEDFHKEYFLNRR